MLHGSGHRAFRMFPQYLQPPLLRWAVRCIIGIDRPETDEPITNFGPGCRSQLARFDQKLGRERQDVFLGAPVFGSLSTPALLQTFDDMDRIKRPVGLD